MGVLMHIIFIAPHFPANQRQFVRALAGIGARVTGIGEAPLDALDGELKSWLFGYEQVRSVALEDDMLQAVRRIQKRGPWVHRLEATIESHMNLAARLREQTGIPGLSSEQVLLCRDKFIMKRFLRSKGVPCARNAEVNSAEDAVAFVREVGFPVILKPKDGAGAAGTYRIDDEAGLVHAIKDSGLSHRPGAMTMEEFIHGHEGFYDTLTCNGQIVFDGICHYYPNVLPAMRNRHVNPKIVVTNRMDASGYQELRKFGQRVVDVMQLGTTATHMEWFYGPKGLSFSEIGARPPGCRLWDLYNFANDFDIYTEWAKALMFGECSPRPSRRYAAGLISLRPDRDGHIVGYEGLEKIQHAFGDNILKMHLPGPGTRTNSVGSGYLGHAWMWVRHEDYDACRKILDVIGDTVKMRAR